MLVSHDRVVLTARTKEIKMSDLRNLKAVNGTVVHAAKEYRNGRHLVTAPACKSNTQVRRMVMTGMPTSKPVTCKLCLKLEN
jgi:hypothetical protein